MTKKHVMHFPHTVLHIIQKNAIIKMAKITGKRETDSQSLCALKHIKNLNAFMSHTGERRKDTALYNIGCFNFFDYNLLFFLLMSRKDSYFLSCTSYLTYDSYIFTS